MPYLRSPQNSVIRLTALVSSMLGILCSLLYPATLSGVAAQEMSQSQIAHVQEVETTQTETVSVTRLALTANDLVYDPTRNLIYASVPNRAGRGGNSILPIYPETGRTGAPLFVGSEPTQLALSDDRRYLYVALDGSGAVRRVDLTNYTAGLQFSLGNSSSAPNRANDIEVLPNQPDAVAVARSTGSIAVYDNGVPRATTTAEFGSARSFYLAFSATADKLYGIGESFNRMTVDAAGVRVIGSSQGGSNSDIVFSEGLLYAPNGRVTDPETGSLVGTFSDVGSSALVAVDSTVDRVYFLSSSGVGSLILRAYDQHTFTLRGTVAVPSVFGFPSSFIRWGANGFALGTNNNQTFLLRTSLVPSAESVSNSDSPAPTASPSPTPHPAAVRQVALKTNDLVYNSSDRQLYASVPGNVGQNGNSITTIDPSAGTVGASAFVGSEPNRLALSDDGRTLYVGLDGAAAVRRFDTTSRTPNLQFSLGGTPFCGAFIAEDIAVQPGNANVIAVSRRRSGCSGNEGVAIFDNGTARPMTSTNGMSINAVEFSAAADTLYGYNSGSTGFELYKLALSNSGVTTTKTTSGVIRGFGVDIKYEGGALYTTTGRAVDAEAQTLLGTYVPESVASVASVVPDSNINRVFFLTSVGSGASTVRLWAYDNLTFLPVGYIDIPSVSGAVSSLVRWGDDGLAFRTSGGQVFLIQSPLFNPPKTTVQLTSPTTGARITQPQVVTLTAEVNPDPRVTIDRVDFYLNGKLVGTTANAPYTKTVRVLNPGTYFFTVRAIDDDGVVTESAPVALTVVKGKRRTFTRR